MDLGIDLGTTYSVMARLDRRGDPQILCNSEGGRTTPSCVYFREDGVAVVGETARQQALLRPGRVVTDAKSAMGSDRTYDLEGDVCCPEEIGACVLKKLVQDAEAATGEKVEAAVITVPAYFDQDRRAATLEAARLAGISCCRLMNEPTAAAVAFAHSGRAEGNVLVYDLGGGTFDVSVLRQEGGSSTVLATGGCSQLGGSFFDRLLCDYVSDQLLQQEHPVDLEGDPALLSVYRDLEARAEQCKRQLSSLEQTELILALPGGVRSFTITRAQYEAMLEPFYLRTEQCLLAVLDRAGLTPADLDSVLLVGGSARTPMIRQRLQALCGLQPARLVDPDEAVAMGAALCTRQLEKVEEVTSRSVGVMIYREELDGEGYCPLIRRESRLPATGRHTFGTACETDQLLLQIAEADGDQAESPVQLHSYSVKLPQRVPKYTALTLEMRLDRSQLLHMVLECRKPVKFRQEYQLDRGRCLWQRERGRRAEEPVQRAVI